MGVTSIIENGDNLPLNFCWYGVRINFLAFFQQADAQRNGDRKEDYHGENFSDGNSFQLHAGNFCIEAGLVPTNESEVFVAMTASLPYEHRFASNLQGLSEEDVAFSEPVCCESAKARNRSHV